MIVGENKIGKSNLLYALRLILDPSLPDSARKLREEDFWDGLARPLSKDHRVTVSLEISEFEDDENQLAILAEHLVEPDPMVARLTYVWQPLPGLEGNPTKDADYEFFVYGEIRGQYTYCASRLICNTCARLGNGYTVPGFRAVTWNLRCTNQTQLSSGTQKHTLSSRSKRG